MAWAQVFGLQRGYLAEVEGEVIYTQASHHHEGDARQSGHFADYAPHHHEHGNTGHAADGHHAAGSGHEDTPHHDGVPIEHVPFKEPLVSTQLSTPEVVLVAATLFAWKLPEFIVPAPVDAWYRAIGRPGFDAADLGPLAALLVVGCTVLLI
jgi:hypothetical protein